MMSAPASEALDNIDFVSATLNQRPAFELTMADVSALVGNGGQPVPAYIDSTDHSSVGAHLLYPKKGLAFRFTHPSRDAKERLDEILVHLTPKYDTASGTNFAAFNGTLTRDVNSHWRVEAFMTAFAEFRPMDRFGREKANFKQLAVEEEELNKRRRNLGLSEERVGSESSKAMIRLLSTIRLNLKTHVVDVDYNDDTKLLERIDIAYPKHLKN
jgi:hypothetical protein